MVRSSPKMVLAAALLLRYSIWNHHQVLFLVDAKKQSSHVVHQSMKTTLLDFNNDPSLLSKDEVEYLDEALIEAYEKVFEGSDDLVILDVDNAEGQVDGEDVGDDEEGTRQLRSSIRSDSNNKDRQLGKPKYKDYDYRQKGSWYCRLCWDDWGYRRHRQLFDAAMNQKTPNTGKPSNANARNYDEHGLIVPEDNNSKADHEVDSAMPHRSRKEHLEEILAIIIRNGPYLVYHDISGCRIDFI